MKELSGIYTKEITVGKNIKLAYFGDNILELNKEIQNHPILMQALSAKDISEFEFRIAVVAAHCGLVLDGDYNGNDLEMIAGKCLERLRNRRPIIVPAYITS